MSKTIQLLVFIFFLTLQFSGLKGQNLKIPQSHINELSSPKMQGRGYVKNGDKKAANYIKKEFLKYNIMPLGETFFQEFSFAMNTFPGKMEIAFNGKTLNAVYDYVVAPDCKSIKGTYPLHYLPKIADTVDAVFDSIVKIDYTGKFIVADFSKRKIRANNPFTASGVILPKKKIYWWASTGHTEAEIPIVLVDDSIMKTEPKNITINIKNKFKKEHKTQNVTGFIKGSQVPDSFIVFTAHYDHLGWMGKGNVFKGANDNASGTSMVLWLANHFSKSGNNPKYSIAFLLFAGEESGLIGSSYFVENPQIPLSKIKALINLDMVGTGSEGISIVNGKSNTKITHAFETINENHSYFADIRVGKQSCNSDYCYFDKAGVPAVFIFTRGKEFQEYHNLDDIPEKLPLTKFNELQKLLIEFAETY